MLQSISVKFLPCTNTKPNRISVSTSGGHRRIVSFDNELDMMQCYIKAAKDMAIKLNWKGQWIGGATKEGYVFVLDDGDNFTV